MPRRRTSNLPLKRRIKLETRQDVQSEMGKKYRAVQHGDLPRAEGAKDIAMLDKICSSGLPDALDVRRGGYVPPVINIYAVPSNYFFSSEQIAAMNRGEQVIKPADCTPLQIEHEEPQSNSVIAFPSTRPLAIQQRDGIVETSGEQDAEIIPRSPEEARLIAELEALPYEQLLQRAQRAGFVDVDKG